MFATFQQEGKPRRERYGKRRGDASQEGFRFLRVCARRGGGKGRGSEGFHRAARLRSRIVSTGFYEVTETEMAGAEGGIKERGSRRRSRAGGKSGVGLARRSTSLHLPTNFMRLVNSRKKLTDRLIHGLTNFII